MALFADYTKTTWSESETETETITVTHPADLPPDNQYYADRGKTVDIDVPKPIETTTTYTNAYIVIVAYSFYKLVTDANGDVTFDVQYKVYNDKQQYLDDPNDWVEEDDILGGYYTFTSSEDIRIRGYEILKSQAYLSNIIDD
jgi:hypothetical protein